MCPPRGARRPAQPPCIAHIVEAQAEDDAWAGTGRPQGGRGGGNPNPLATANLCFPLALPPASPQLIDYASFFIRLSARLPSESAAGSPFYSSLLLTPFYCPDGGLVPLKFILAVHDCTAAQSGLEFTLGA